MGKYLTIEQIKARYFPEKVTPEKALTNHLAMLTEVENARQLDGTYSNANQLFKENSVRRIQHYIDVCTNEEKALAVYPAFLETMRRSIAMCKEARV